MKERIVWVDYIKAFCIFFVVLLHANIGNPVASFARVFVIPTFFFMSGLLFDIQKYLTYSVFFKKRILKILTSYLFFNILTYLFWVVIGRHVGLDVENSELANPLRPLLGILLGDYFQLLHYRPFWFLACLVSVEVLYYFLFKKNVRKFSFVILTGVFAIAYLDYHYKFIFLPWGFNIALSMILFFSLGVFSRPFLLSNFLKNNLFFLVLVVLISFSIVCFCSVYNSEVKVFIREYGNYILFLIGALSGIVFMVSGSKLLAENFSHNKFLRFIGRNTLIILALHLIVFSFVKAITFYIFKLPLSIYENQWAGVIMSVLSVMLLCPIIIFINRYLPFLIGKDTHDTSSKI